MPRNPPLGIIELAEQARTPLVAVGERRVIDARGQLPLVVCDGVDYPL
jgi:hypothetical protein